MLANFRRQIQDRAEIEVELQQEFELEIRQLKSELARERKRSKAKDELIKSLQQQLEQAKEIPGAEKQQKVPLADNKRQSWKHPVDQQCINILCLYFVNQVFIAP